MKTHVPQDASILERLHFEDNICHECQKAVPSYRYCVEMYGGVFKQTYGWYINKQAREFGIHNGFIQRDMCPDEILDLVGIDEKDYRHRYAELQEKDYAKADDLNKKWLKQYRRVQRAIENEVRQKLGHKKVGEAWTSETPLYYIVKRLLPDEKIVHHFRDDFLQGLELDIFIPSLRIGIEYQGLQHYKPVKHWGGEEGLKKCQERDKKKRSLCTKAGVNLVYFNYDEGLTERFVKNRLFEADKGLVKK